MSLRSKLSRWWHGRSPAQHHHALSKLLSDLEDKMRAASAEVRRLQGSHVPPGLLRRAERRLKRLRRRTQRARLLVEMARPIAARAR